MAALSAIPAPITPAPTTARSACKPPPNVSFPQQSYSLFGDHLYGCSNLQKIISTVLASRVRRGVCGVTNTYEQIELSVESNIATIKLNRPERFNALGNRILEELGRALDEIEVSEDVRAVILTGTGDRA